MKAKAKRQARDNAVLPITGWLLLAREESDHETGERGGDWHICWHDIFGTKKSALTFAKGHGWPQPYKAVRGMLAVS
jgi:hypothetical protein